MKENDITGSFQPAFQVFQQLQPPSHLLNREHQALMKVCLTMRHWLSGPGNYGFAALLMILVLQQPLKTLADDPSGTTPEPVREAVQKLDQQIEAVDQLEQMKQGEMIEIRKQTSEIQRQLQQVQKQIESIQAEQKKLTQTQQEQVKAAAEADQKRKEAEATLEKARKSAEEAKKTADLAAKAPVETAQKLTTLMEKIGPLLVASSKVAAQYQTVMGELEQLENQLASFREQRLTFRTKIESILREQGAWISFSDQIAPIFYEKCVACHNPRNAEGQYVMTTYDGVMTTGESDGAVEPGKSADSLLCLLIDDGSMPKGAEPLSEAERGLIHNWIDQGARLDVAASATDLLIRLMPRRHQPVPPEVYRAPIPVTALAISADGKLLASSGYHEVLIWSIADGTLIKRISNVAEFVYGLDFHPEGNVLAVASGTPGRLGEVKLFDVTSGEMVNDLFVSEDSVFSVKFSPDGKRIAAAGAEGLIVIAQVNSQGKPRPILVNSHSDWVNDVAWSADGTTLVSASRDKTAKVFDAATGKLRITFNGHKSNVTRARFVGEGNTIASVGHDNQVRFWDATNVKELKKANSFGVDLNCLEVIDVKNVLSAGASENVFFRLLDDEKRTDRLSVGQNWISSLALTPDHSELVCGDLSGNIFVCLIKGDRTVTRSWLAIPQSAGDKVSSERNPE